MTYLIYNEYYNRGVKTVELRNNKNDNFVLKLNDESYQVGEFVEVDVINHKQVISNKVMRPNNFLEFYPDPKIDIEILKVEISKYFSLIKDEGIKIILKETIFSNDDFFYYPAAKAIHHAYIGGLAHHTLNMLKLSEFYCQMYKLDSDLMYAGCMLHDFGKIYELQDYGVTYSVEGNLLGHINICYEQVSYIAKLEGINENKKVMALKHIILSHHGKLEYGSPKEPMLLEAYVLSQIDEVDAKIDLFLNVLSDTPANKLSSPIMAMDRRRILNLK